MFTYVLKEIADLFCEGLERTVQYSLAYSVILLDKVINI